MFPYGAGVEFIPLSRCLDKQKLIFSGVCRCLEIKVNIWFCAVDITTSEGSNSEL